MKKVKNLIFLGIAMLFTYITPVFAREMSIDELGSEALKKEPSTNYIYVIGEYAFTSKHTLTTQDVMLAAKSIKTTDDDGKTDSGDIYKKMAIQKITAINEIKDGKIVVTGWRKDGDILNGGTTLDDKIDIKYIDYEFYPEISKAEIKTEIPSDPKYTESLKSLSFEGGNESHSKNLEFKNGKLTGLLLKYDEMSDAVFSGDDKTGYYFAFVINVPNATNETTVDLIGAKNTKKLTIKNFDVTGENAGILVLWSVDPKTKKENKNIKIVIDYDGNKEDYKESTYTIDYSDIEFQTQTVANIKVDGSRQTSDIPSTDKYQLSLWGYTFPDDIKLSEDNSHKNGNLSYDPQTGKLTGTIKEQKLKHGFNDADLDSYFYTFTIRPEVVTKDIKVTIKSGESKEKEFKFDDFTKDGDNYVLSVLQHISKEEKDSDDKKLTITVDSDGDSKDYYLNSKEYTIDYSDLDFVDLHTITYNDNEENETSSKDIYDGEKLQKPTNPVKEQHELDDNQYNTFHHWNKQEGESVNSSDSEFEFDETNKSLEEITDDITLYPIWEIDVDQYINDAMTHINQKESIKNMFKFETTEEEKTLNLEILDRNTKLEDIEDTAIASTIAHALASGEIKDITIELDKNSKTFAADKGKNEDELKTEVSAGLREFFEKEAGDAQKTLNDLYTKWSKDSDGLELNITPIDTIAKVKGQVEKSSVSYYIKIEEELMITFDAGTLTDPETQFVKTGENLTQEQLPSLTIPEKEQAYRTFDGWYNESEQVTNLTDVRSDTELTAHYKLNFDKFIEDVVNDLDSDQKTEYSNNFHDNFDLVKNENNITIKLNSPNVSLSELSKTTIPGTIAYILQKGEIKDITLTVGGNSETLKIGDTLSGSDINALKAEIIEGAKDVFDSELANHEKDTTLDQLEYENKDFKIKVGSPSETIKLVDKDGVEVTIDDEKTYTFNFDSDFAVVNNSPKSELGAQDIKTVLEKNEYSTIYLDGNYELSDTLNIEKDLTIKGIISEDKKPTLSLSEKDYVIEVKQGTVSISDLKITGGKKSEVKVDSDAIVTVDNIDISGIEKSTETSENIKDIPNSGILVEGTLSASNIINSSETYNTPAIAILYDSDYNKSKELEKTSTASVKASDMTVNDTYINVTKREGNDLVGRYYGRFYYTDSNKSKIYIMGVMDNFRFTSGPFAYIKYYYYGDTIDISKMGYESGKAPDDASNSTTHVFDYLKVKDKNTRITNDTKAEDVLIPNYTTMVEAVYKNKSN